MDSDNIVNDSGLAYPILYMPKKCTTLETSSEIADNVYMNVNITSPDMEGNDTMIYNGYCNVKLVETFNVSPNRDRASPDSIDIDQMPVILSGPSPPYSQSQVWIDPSRSPYVYNHYDPASQENYSIRESGGLITVEQHNTYITQNVYNCMESNVLNCKEAPSPVNETGWKRYRKVQESVTGQSDINLSYYEEDEFECGVFLSQLPEEIMNETQSRIRKVQESVTGQSDNNLSYYEEDEFECGVFLSQLPEEIMNETQSRIRKVQESVTGQSDNNLSYYEEDEFECGVFLSQLPEEIMNETQSRIRDERKFSSQQENNALKQLMSNVQSSSRQRKTILFLGHNSHSGQTIQNISYNDPGVMCAAVDVDNELVIDGSAANPRKKYQCDRCKKLFPQISSFRQHMVGNQNKNQVQAENELSFMCMDCGKNLKNQRKFEIHCLGHGDPELECPKCGKVFASKFSLRVHMKIHNRKYPCNYCSMTYATFHDLRSHLVKKHSFFMCNDENCAFVTRKLSDLEIHQHWNKTEAKDDTVQYVNVDMDTPDELESTFKTEDHELLNPDLVQDDISDSSSIDVVKSPSKEGSIQGSKSDSTKSSEELANEDFALPSEENSDKTELANGDIVLPSEENSDKTELANEDFALSSEDNSDKTVSVGVDVGERIRKADSVIATVMSNSIFLLSTNKARVHRYRKTCEVCQKSFDRMDDLKRHLIEHVIKSTLAKTPVSITGRLNITCEVCQAEVFTRVDKYKTHLREHAKLTIYKCTFCDKSFSDSSNFSKHKKIHSRTYLQCDLCLRKFNSKKMIAQHMDQHKRTKPVQCRLCLRVFHFESMLNKHMRSTHRKEEKYRCRFCDEISNTVKEKWEHEWEVHSIRKMIVDCLVCGAQYRKYTELKRHCIEEHRMDLPKAKKLGKSRYKISKISYNLNFEQY